MLPLAFAFDVFGTVVDWRSSVARESVPHLAALGRADVDPHRFADAWRARYQPAMATVRDGRRDWVVLDTLHREMLEATLAAHVIDLAAVGEARLADWTRAWHRLDPWPDSVAGLDRLRALAPVVTLSNGNVALIVAMARRAGLHWDAVLGAELARAYKPDPAAYLGTAAALGVAPGDLCLVAAHHSDLAAARGCGLLTAFIARPQEYGGAPAPDVHHVQEWDWHATGLDDLAAQMEAAATAG
ncbi:haloacid dehalogenase type II [Sphingomonas sp.]|uniref:haloacid dehalogenase type II n=1 Tax=Sphingomonas sp. TaxID=28214 RepID=UPI003CC512E0